MSRLDIYIFCTAIDILPHLTREISSFLPQELYLDYVLDISFKLKLYLEKDSVYSFRRI